MSFGRRGGERRLARATNARAPGADTKNRACAQETRPSLGPKTRTRQSSLCIGRKLDGGALAVTSRLGKPAQAGGTNTGAIESGRSAARRVVVAPAREAARHVRKGRRSRPPSLRGSRARVWLLARRCMLQKSAGDVWSRISSANALQKERTGSSEQGPSSAALPAGETVGDRSAKRRIASSNSPMKEGEDRDKAQGGERSSSSGCTIAKSGEVVAGPGL